MQILERDFEDYLFEHPEKLGLQKIIGRQVHVPSGIIDLIGIHEYGWVCVIELKMEDPKSEHLTQVCRYAADLESIVSDFPSVPCDNIPKVQKMLVYVGGMPTNKIMFEAAALGVNLHRTKTIFSCEVSDNILYRYRPLSSEEREKKQEEAKNLLRPIFMEKHNDYIKEYNKMIEPFRLLLSEYVNDDNWDSFYSANIIQSGHNFIVFDILKTVLDEIGNDSFLKLFEKYYSTQEEHIAHENTINWWGFKDFCKAMTFEKVGEKDGD